VVREKKERYPFRKSAKGVLLDVRVQPRSSKRAVEVMAGGALKVRLTAPPAEGRANAQLIEVLAEEFGVAKGSIRILRGLSSRNKTVEIEGIEML
jgi:uncharacterized protein (TIGR00251 family)